jgi:hypothetical protein
MTSAPGPHHRLTDSEALGCLVHADRPTLLTTAADALVLARDWGANPARATDSRNALILAAVALHLLLWDRPALPGEGAPS